MFSARNSNGVMKRTPGGQVRSCHGDSVYHFPFSNFRLQ